MILGFNKRFPDKILSGEKIHTIREDKHNRWEIGRWIHFATGVRTPEYKCFKQDICDGTQKIEIKYNLPWSDFPSVYIDGHLFSYFIERDWEVLYELARNDGFKDFKEFCGWFNKDYSGKIIHWTSKRYVPKKLF